MGRNRTSGRSHSLHIIRQLLDSPGKAPLSGRLLRSSLAAYTSSKTPLLYFRLLHCLDLLSLESTTHQNYWLVHRNLHHHHLVHLLVCSRSFWTVVESLSLEYALCLVHHLATVFDHAYPYFSQNMLLIETLRRMISPPVLNSLVLLLLPALL